MIPLPPSLTFAQAPQALGGLQAALERLPAGQGCELDAQAMTEFDTSAIAVLLQLRRQAEARGLAFRVAHPPAKLRQLAALYGVEALLGLEGAAATAAAA